MASVKDERCLGKDMAMATDEKIKDILILDRPEDIKLVFSEKHSLILKLIKDKEMSISDLARSLSMNPGSIHYYLKDLEKHGLVKLVREEVKGGIIKKYYRTAAKRILLEAPTIYDSDSIDMDPMNDVVERMIKSIEYLGFYLPPENMEDARDLLLRYNNRLKNVMIEINDVGLDSVEDNGIIFNHSLNLVKGIRLKNDPEMARIYSEFEKLFLPHG